MYYGNFGQIGPSQEKDAWGCLSIISIAGLFAVQGVNCYCERQSLKGYENEQRNLENIPLEEPVNLGNGSDLNLPSPNENYLRAPQVLDGRAIKIPPCPPQKRGFDIVPIFRQLRWPRFEFPHRPQNRGGNSNQSGR